MWTLGGLGRRGDFLADSLGTLGVFLMRTVTGALLRASIKEQAIHFHFHLFASRAGHTLSRMAGIHPLDWAYGSWLKA